MLVLKCIGIVCALVVLCGFLGALIPFLIGMFDDNGAWSFVPMVTVPLGMLVGLVIGLVVVFRMLSAANA